MIVLGAVCILASIASVIVPERLWRRTQAAAVLRSYPWRARMAVRRPSHARADDGVPMALLKATRIRMRFERHLWPVRLVAACLYLAGLDLLVAHNAGTQAPHLAFLSMGVALTQGMIVLVAWAMTWMVASKRYAQIERVIELRERGL